MKNRGEGGVTSIRLDMSHCKESEQRARAGVCHKQNEAGGPDLYTNGTKPQLQGRFFSLNLIFACCVCGRFEGGEGLN